jgi:hypothetical protein
MKETIKPVTKGYTPVSGIFLRIYWIAIAHGAALILTAKMALSSLQRSPLLNLVLALLLISVIIARYIDIRYCKGETSDFKKATIADWRSWSLKVVTVYVIGFVLLHMSVYFHM